MKLTLGDLRRLHATALQTGKLESWSQLALDFMQQAVDEIDAFTADKDEEDRPRYVDFPEPRKLGILK